MAPPTRTPRTKWIDEGLRALAAGGPDAVRIEALAKSLGVSKGGFYGHFQDRKALLDAMLDTWERRTTDDVLARIEREGGDAPDQHTAHGGADLFGGWRPTRDRFSRPGLVPTILRRRAAAPRRQPTDGLPAQCSSGPSARTQTT